MPAVIGSLQKDSFNYTTTIGYQEILFTFSNIAPPCVLKDITVTLAPPTPGSPVDFSVEMTRVAQNYYLINKVGFTGNRITSDNIPLWFDMNTSTGSFKINAPIGTTFTVAFTAVSLSTSSTYSSKIQGEYDQTITFSTPFALHTNTTSGYECIKGISIALPVPSDVNVSLFYNDQSTVIPFGTAAFTAAGSNSAFIKASPTFGYLLDSGGSISLSGDVNGIAVDYFVHYTV